MLLFLLLLNRAVYKVWAQKRAPILIDKGLNWPGGGDPPSLYMIGVNLGLDKGLPHDSGPRASQCLKMALVLCETLKHLGCACLLFCFTEMTFYDIYMT